MSKEEISLELMKLIAEKLVVANSYTENSGNLPKAITDAYNYIYENIKISEH